MFQCSFGISEGFDAGFGTLDHCNANLEGTIIFAQRSDSQCLRAAEFLLSTTSSPKEVGSEMVLNLFLGIWM